MDAPLSQHEQHLFLHKLAHTTMPFGKYRGRFLDQLPDEYILWLKRKSQLRGELAFLMDNIYEIKLNGLEGLMRSIRSRSV